MVNTKTGWINGFALTGVLLVVCCLFTTAPIKVAAQEATPCAASNTSEPDTAADDQEGGCPAENVDPTNEEPSVVVGIPIISDTTPDVPDKFTPDRSENIGDYTTPAPVVEPAPSMQSATAPAAQSPPANPVRQRRIFRRSVINRPNDVPAVAGVSTTKPETPNQVTTSTIFESGALPALLDNIATGAQVSVGFWLGLTLLVIGACTAVGLFFRPNSSRS